MATSASERARRRWNKEPMSFGDIAQLPTREARAAALVGHYEHIEKLERAKRRPNKRLLAEIAAKKRPLELVAAGGTVTAAGASNVATVIQIAEEGVRPAPRNDEPKKDRDR